MPRKSRVAKTIPDDEFERIVDAILRADKELLKVLAKV